MSERQPLMRPGAANEVWSADFLFDRIASGRTLKCLVIVDDATHEAIVECLSDEPASGSQGERSVRTL